jgi:hypothetical protein
VCYGADAPECYSEVKRKARKDHRCYECHITIHKGDTYTYISGIWDGRPDSFKNCEACCILKEYVYSESDCDEYPPMGCLLETAVESAQNSGGDYDAEYHPNLLD